jgi:hypothetical protein
MGVIRVHPRAIGAPVEVGVRGEICLEAHRGTRKSRGAEAGVIRADEGNSRLATRKNAFADEETCAHRRGAMVNVWL